MAFFVIIAAWAILAIIVRWGPAPLREQATRGLVPFRWINRHPVRGLLILIVLGSALEFVRLMLFGR